MVASSGSGKSRGSGGGGGSGDQEVKKGPWTAAEDGILIEYVRKHGEGNWNAVQRNSGLMRCGKSCRLRWANHLRPNLKKGSFSPDEERLIIELHSKIGNKWARMASQLPGRTDNEIKNYWNTRVKRLQRANLPIYPNEINPHQTHRNPSPPSLSSLSASKFNPSLSLFRPFSNPNCQFKPFHHNQNVTSFGLPFSSSPSSLLMNQNLQRDLFKSSDFDMNPVGVFVPSLETELPSIQYSPLSAGPTPASSGSTSGDDLMIKSPEMGNSGLLDALLEESKALVNAGKLKEEISTPDYSCVGMKQKDPMEEMNYQIDDDLSSLLNNFPLTVPVPDWYESSLSTSNGESPKIMGGNLAINTLPGDSLSPAATTSETSNPKWNMGACRWNNMPSIC